MLNNINLQGRITKDLELKTSNTGVEILKFSIAVQRNFKDKTTNEYGVDFFNCIAFGKTAQFIIKYSSKGKIVTLSGNVQNGSYKKDDGSMAYTSDVIVKEIDVFTGNTKEEQSLNNQQSSLNDQDLPFWRMP